MVEADAVTVDETLVVGLGVSVVVFVVEVVTNGVIVIVLEVVVVVVAEVVVGIVVSLAVTKSIFKLQGQIQTMDLSNQLCASTAT